MRLKLILDPASGRERAKRTWPMIQKILEAKNIIYDLDITEGPGQGALLAKKAVAAGFDTIVALGGDGSVNEVANGVIGSQATFGVIPCGEGNDFAHMLGISEKNLEEACDVLKAGFTRTIDVGVINGRYFLEVVGIGFDAEVAERKNKTPKFIQGFFAYLYQVLPVLLTYVPKKIKIKIDGINIETTILLLYIGNGKSTGGGFLLAPEAELDDGTFDICLVKYAGMIATLTTLPKSFTGEHVKASFINILRGVKEIEVSSDDLLPAQIDGEVVREKSYQIKILPKKLKVIAKKS